MNTKYLLWAVLVLAVAGCGWWLIAAHSTENTTDSAVVKIGLILPLTGSQANLGEAAKNGADLAIAKINGDTTLKHKYEFVIEDDSFDTSKTASAAQKLLGIDQVSAIISLGSGPGNVVNPLAEAARVPHIGTADDANVANGDYNFIDWTQPPSKASALVAELQKRGITKVAIMGVNQQGFVAIDKDFTAKAKAAGITITSDDTFNPGTTDFRTIIARASKLEPQIYLLDAFTPELEVLGQQIKEAGITTPLTSIDSFGLSAKPEIFEGDWFIGSALPTDAFSAEYKAAYNTDVGPTAPNVYDEVSLIVRAVENTNVGGVPTGTEIAESLAKTEGYSGAMGPLSITPEGIFLSNPAVMIVKGGVPVPYN